MLAAWLIALIAPFLSIFFLALLKRSTSYWKNKGVVQYKPLPFFGNYLPLILLKKNASQIINDLYHEFPEERLIGLYEFTNPTLVVKDPELIEQVLVRDFTSYPDHGQFVFERTSVMSDGIFMMQGEKWRVIRNKLLSTFTTSRMRAMFPGVLEVCQELIDRRPERLDRQSISRFATDSFLRSLMGAKLQPDGEDEFRQNVKDMFDAPLSRYFQQQFITYYPKLSNLLNMKFMPSAMDEYFKSFVYSLIDSREKNGHQRRDFTDLLVELRKTRVFNIFNRSNIKTDKIFEMTDDLLVSQAFFFFFVALDTTSLVMLFTLFELARHPDVQERARAEARQAVDKHGGMTYDSVREMKYIEQCIQESLRIHPTVVLLMRVAERNTNLGGVEVEKGTRILIPTFTLQMDPKYWPEPERYLPERFEDGVQRNKFAYLPFSEGPRICAGKKFSLVEVATFVSFLLLNYELSVGPETRTSLTYKMRTLFLEPENPLTIRLKELEEQCYDNNLLLNNRKFSFK